MIARRSDVYFAVPAVQLMPISPQLLPLHLWVALAPAVASELNSEFVFVGDEPCVLAWTALHGAERALAVEQEGVVAVSFGP